MDRFLIFVNMKEICVWKWDFTLSVILRCCWVFCSRNRAGLICAGVKWLRLYSQACRGDWGKREPPWKGTVLSSQCLPQSQWLTWACSWLSCAHGRQRVSQAELRASPLRASAAEVFVSLKHTSVILAVRKLRQEDCKFKASLFQETKPKFLILYVAFQGVFFTYFLQI